MQDLLIALLDFIGFSGFAYATYKNFRIAKTTAYFRGPWTVLTVATAFLAIWAFFVMLEWLDIWPGLLDELQQITIAVAFGLIMCYIILGRHGLMKPIE